MSNEVCVQGMKQLDTTGILVERFAGLPRKSIK